MTILLALTLAVAWPVLGAPVLHPDEEFYFLVADRMWHGNLPFVDIWDRKPIGLFLIYALLRPLSGESMIAVQIAGTVFNAVTGLVVWDLSQSHLGRAKAILPAALYAVWMGAFGGANGQAPVFHNLLVALAFWLFAQAWRNEGKRDAFLSGLGAMASIGVAIQLKYTPAIPGIVVGLGFMWLEWVRHISPLRLALRSAAWVAMALLPTLAALGYYSAIGHFQEFWFANFSSIFLRGHLTAEYLEGLRLFMILRGLPLVILAALGALMMTQSKTADLPDMLIFAWLGAELIVLVLLGNYYDHYALPLIAPLSIMAGWALASTTPVNWTVYLAVLFLGGLAASHSSAPESVQARETIQHLTRTARPYLRHGCLFIFDGPSFLYTTTKSCLLTRFAYPDHLSNAVEEHAVGLNTQQEMARILKLRPALLVTSNRALIPKFNERNRMMVQRALKREYRLVDFGLAGYGSRHYLLWARADLIPPGQPVVRVPPPPR